MRHRPLFVAVTIPLMFACVLPGRGGGGGWSDTSAGTLDTSIAACVPADEPVLQLGFGQDRWSPVGASVEAERGGQGGQHLWFAFRSTGFQVAERSVVHVVGRAEGETLIDVTARLAWTCHPDGIAEVVGLLVPVPSTAIGTFLSLDVTVTDPEARTATATAGVLVN